MRRRSSMPPSSQSDEDHSPSSAPHRRSSFSSLLPWHHSDSSPPSPASSFSSTASAIDDPPIRNRPWHIHDRSHPKFLTGPLHDLELNLIKTRKAMEESKAEEIHSFPDASETLRTRPLLQNSRRKVNFGWLKEMNIVAVSGDLLAMAWGVRVAVWSAQQDDKIGWCEVGLHGIGTNIVTSIAWSETGRYLWVGCNSGALFEFDSESLYRNPRLPLPIIAHRHDAHPHSPVVLIKRVSSFMYTLDESGRLVIWLPSPRSGTMASLHGYSKVLQVQNRPTWVDVLDGIVYITYRFHVKNKAGKKVSLSVLEVLDVTGQQPKMLGEYEWEENADGHPGQVTSACVVPAHREFVFMGHDSGHVSVWQPKTAKRLDVRKVSLAEVTAMCGPSRFLWIGRADGVIDVLDIQGELWRVIKRWQAHDAPIESLTLDPRSLWTASQLRVMSAANDGACRFWDGLLRKDWITLKMQSKVEEYCTFSKLRLGIFTWNIDGVAASDFEAASPVNQTLLATFLRTLDNPDLISFNFQELIDLSDLTLAARTFLFATKHHDVTLRYKHWSAVLSEAVLQRFGIEYELVKEEKLVGLYTILFARKAIHRKIRDLEATGIKTGFSAEYGNKGSVLLRFVVDDTSFCLINSHLAAGTNAPGRRERDLIEIFDSGPRFTRPASGTKRAYVGGGDGTQISDAELIFFSGDLNFRIDLPRSQVLTTLVKSPTAVQDLLPYDELTRLRKTNPSFRLRNMREAPICFPPTYKYDHNSKEYDTSAKQRTPSWCDRILWRSQARESSVKCVAYGRYEADVSDHRPVSATFEIEVKREDHLRAEDTLRGVLHEWAIEEERLLDSARDYYKLSN